MTSYARVGFESHGRARLTLTPELEVWPCRTTRSSSSTDALLLLFTSYSLSVPHDETMSIAHGVRRAAVIGAGQMGALRVISTCIESPLNTLCRPWDRLCVGRTREDPRLTARQVARPSQVRARAYGQDLGEECLEGQAHLRGCEGGS